MKTLVTYFSASGVTKRVAEKIADAIDADIFEISPETPYSSADLDYTNKNSRSTIEMNDKSFRPPIKETIDISEYDIILIGFPVWWYTAPTIINTFIESCDMAGKTAIAFCTSGGTGIRACENDLKNAYPKINWKAGRRLYGRESDDEIKNWVNE
ncbi:flavodoxin [Methanobrevibacter olleyae]|uniref:Flavodoxin n=1 Tax=Methanobrevibacter olleyae TaxID=294671 RepID=A0A126R184_METOL|nr:flavodoxin [Methanobrevibacter olleyae]AMK16140.1 flavodoxin [Methanobrevibacter olleyae]SFL32136.1 Putative NADPH-quinone reductase (modulator of drug activity B) [Methanobrevibacter olleyae]